MTINPFDEVAAASEHSLPISTKRQIELLKISNDIWHYISVQHNCTDIEAQLVSAMIATYANNHGQQQLSNSAE